MDHAALVRVRDDFGAAKAVCGRHTIAAKASRKIDRTETIGRIDRAVNITTSFRAVQSGFSSPLLRTHEDTSILGEVQPARLGSGSRILPMKSHWLQCRFWLQCRLGKWTTAHSRLQTSQGIFDWLFDGRNGLVRKIRSRSTKALIQRSARPSLRRSLFFSDPAERSERRIGKRNSSRRNGHVREAR